MLPLLESLRFIVNHPMNRQHRVRALSRYVRWQVGSRVLGAPAAVPFVDDTRLLVTPGMTGATGNIYCGLHDFDEMGFVLHALRPGELLADVGANVGTYTILAAGGCGARVVALEPHPGTFSHLLDNVRLNRLDDRVRARNMAAGESEGTLRFTSAGDVVNHVIPAAEAARGGAGGAGAPGIDVPVATLDAIFGGEVPAVIKIDVEGFETAVLRGAGAVLREPGLLAMVVELNGEGARYGYDDAALHAQLLGMGFTACRYDPFTRVLSPAGGEHPASSFGNGLYVRDPAAMQERLRAAPVHRVHGRRL